VRGIAVGNQTSVKLSYKPRPASPATTPKTSVRFELRPSAAELAVDGTLKMDVLLQDADELFSAQ
jgi:hypothetical protein